MKFGLKWSLFVPLTATTLAAAILMFTRPEDLIVLKVEPRPVVQALGLVGRARPEQEITVNTEVGGRLQKLLVHEGQRVNAGQAVAIIESAEAEAQLAQAGAELAQREADLEASTAILSGELRERNRLRQLADKQTVAGADLDRAETAVQGAEARQRAADASAQSARAGVLAATARLRRHTLISPIDGVVLERRMDEGQTLSAYEVVFVLGGTAVLEIEAEADEAYAGSLHAGQTATLRATGSDKTFSSVVKEVLPQVNPSTGARRVRLTAPADQADLVPGRTVEATIVIERRDAALSLPRTALLDILREPSVYVVENDMVVRRAVRFRDWPAPEVLVLDGLAANALVVSDPSRTAPGAHVHAVTTATTPSSKIMSKP